MQTREVTWGEALMVRAARTPGGMKAVAIAIAREVGVGVGVRSTFAKLYDVDSPETLDERDRYRAWLVLCAVGEDPESWGIGDDAVPAAIDAKTLKQRLIDWRARRDSNPQPSDP